MSIAYDVLHFIQAALPTIGIITLAVFVILYVRKDADGQRVLFALAIRAIDFLLPQREAAQVRRARREAKQP